MIFYIVTMEADTLNNELFKFLNYDTLASTTSAFVQQRNKIDYHAFEYLFHSFNSMFKPHHFYKDYLLLDIYGSTLPITYHPNDKSTFIPQGKCKGYNNVRINSLHDLLFMVYTDMIINLVVHILMKMVLIMDL